MSDNEVELQPTDSFICYDDHAEEYRVALAAFDLEIPVGKVLRGSPLPEPEANTEYEPGVAEVQLLFNWLYLVESAAVEAYSSGDNARANYWVEVAASLVETDTFKKFNDHKHDTEAGTSWFEAVIETAREGDFSAMLEQVEAYESDPADVNESEARV